MSSFAGLHTALSGLVAQRYGLDTTGANVANANTPGYSRQRVVMDPTNPTSTGAALFSRWDGPGTGVRVTDLQRVTDELVATRVRTERSTAQFMDVERTAYARLEVSLGEPGDTGLTSRLSTMWASFQDLANNPGSEAARTQVLQAARGVTDSLGAAAAGVDQAWNDQHSALRLAVEEVNNTSAAVGELNAAIREATAAGKAPNELLDQRDALVVRLSELTGGTVRTGELGTVDVFVGGTAIVRGERSTPLAVGAGGADDLAAVRAGGAVGVTGLAGSAVDVPGGRIGAVLVGLNTTWPGVMDSLDATAADVATQVNAVHVTGAGLDGVDGREFFTGTTAAGLTVAVTDTDHVAAALPGSGPLDATVADRLGRIGQQVGSPDSGWRRFVADVGAQTQAANRRSTAQAVVVGDVMAARESVSGVDIDEELTNMVMFQRAYEGSARMLTAVDQALDTLINRTGLVGR
ncbi:flagellar hook-associated protein FlgK [Aquipuribacter sp. MA13-6]|uniref:flagellar hook-associated protein FlgK n=1 Tax=unclassified Aquipuribacter TaxID=2635084 RepID=UPI003EEE6766